MSRFGPRHSSGDLAYGEEPQRWDRDRFEQYRRGGPPPPPPPVEERETFRFTEHDRPGHQEIRIQDRVVERSPPPRRRFEDKRDSREFFAEDRYGPPARPRRSDRDLFGDEDPRELLNRQLAPYRRKSIVERDIDYRETSRGPPPPRPGMLMRRQSSLDTYDRRPMRDEYRIPAGVPVPLPRRRSPSRGTQYYEEDYEDVRRRDYSPHDYRDVEIMREKTVRRRRSKAKSEARSSARSVAPSVAHSVAHSSARSTSSSSESSVEEKSRHSSPERKVGKKGKTRMPKRLVRKQAVIELGYDFEEEEDFIVVQRALDKDHIDEVIRISANYKNEPRTKTYRYDEPPTGEDEHFETLRTEWINPPSVRAPSVRAPSPARSTRTRRSSPARTVRQPSPPPAPPQQTTIYIRDPPPAAPPPAPIYIREPAPPPPPAPVYIREQAPQPPSQHPMTIVLPEHRRREQSRDINAEIRALEAEAAAVRLEREAHAHSHRELVIRRPEETNYEMVEYRDRRPDREYDYGERERAKSPKRDVVRVEKDRKGRMALVRSAR